MYRQNQLIGSFAYLYHNRYILLPMIVIGVCLPQVLIRASLKKTAGGFQLRHVLSYCPLLTRLIVKHQVSSVNVDYNVTIPSDPGSLSSRYIVKQSFVKSEGFIVGQTFFSPV